MKTITIFTSGKSRGNPGPSAIGILAVDKDDKTVFEISESIGNSNEDFAEYFAVVRALQALKDEYEEKVSEMQFELRLDSEVVMKQLNNESKIEHPGLVPYFIEIHNLRVSSIKNLKLTLITKEQNKKAETLLNKVLDAK